MKIRIITTLMFFGLLLPLINGCGKSEEESGHFSMNPGGGGGDMNFEQQALKMEQDDLNKLKSRAHADAYAKSDHGSMDSKEFNKIHKGVVDAHDPNEVIAIVNGENIIRLELDRILDKIKNKISKSRIYTLEKRILDDLITQKLLKQFIKKQNIQVDHTRIEDEIKGFRENLKKNPDTKDKSLETLLEEQGGSIEELRVALDISFSIDAYLDRTVSEEELKEYFSKNIGNFNGETITASHILIDTREIEEDEEKLKEAREKIEKIKEELDQDDDFAKLAEENSDCPSSRSGGNLGTFGRGEMVKAFTDTAFAMNVGSISEPVKTKFGYHIIKVTDKQEGKDVKFEEEKGKAKIALFNEKTINLIEDLNINADTKILLKETPQLAGGGHGSYSGGHGSIPGGSHGGSFGASPHWNVPSGSSPHGSMSGGSPHGNISSGASPHGKVSSEKKVEESFSLTN